MRALVTGGAGFIGSHMVEALVAAGHDVCVLDDFSSGRKENLTSVWDKIEVRAGSVTHCPSVELAMIGTDMVFHMAAITSVPRSIKDPLDTNAANLTGTLNVLHYAKQSNVQRVVFSSSSSVYGQGEHKKHESMAPVPISPYAIQKYTSERYCRMYYDLYGLKTISLRYFNVFGPRQRPDGEYAAVIPRFIQAACSGLAPVIYGSGEQIRDFTYVSDAVSANMLAASVDIYGGVVNVSGDNVTSINSLWENVQQIVGVKINAVSGEPRIGEVKNSAADLTFAKKILGYSPKIKLYDGLKLTVEAI